MKRFELLWISVIVVVLDQISKITVRNFIDFGVTNRIEITPEFFWLTHVQNSGAAFSLSFGNIFLNKIIFIIIPIAAIILILLLFRKASSKLEKIAFALILGGAFGNLIDRILFGSVTDFIWCDFPDLIMERWPVFNIADSSIVIAITLLIIHALFFSKKITEDK